MDLWGYIVDHGGYISWITAVILWITAVILWIMEVILWITSVISCGVGARDSIASKKNMNVLSALIE